MRTSEKLSIINKVIDRGPWTIRIRQTVVLGGVVNEIEQWPEIHSALSVLVGYTENGHIVPGLLRNNPSTDYVQDLIARFPSSTDNFPSGLFDNLQRQIDGVCKDLPIIIPVLEQISPGSSDSTLTAEFRGQLSLDDFAVTVSDVVRVMDILKIKNEISEVWTDYGSTVFGVEVGSEMARVVLHAVISGTEQFRDAIADFTPAMVKRYFQLFSQISEKLSGEPLDDSIIEENVVDESIRNLAGSTITVNLTPDVSAEQKNGIGLAIPQIAAMTNRGWNISISSPSIDGSQITQSTIILADTVNIALPPSPSATGDTQVSETEQED